MKHKPVISRTGETAVRSSELKQNPNKVRIGIAKRIAKKIAMSKGRYYIVGAGTVLDIGGSHLKSPSLESIAEDRKRIQRDLWTIGDDMRIVLRHQLSQLKK